MRNFYRNLRSLFNSNKRMLECESGAAALEYGILLAFVAVVIIAGLTILGPKMETLFTNVGTTVGDLPGAETFGTGAG